MVMKSMLLTGMVMMLIAAGQPATAQSQPDKALQDAAAARTKALASGDADTWGKYTTDDFIVIGVDGTQQTKAQRMAEIKGAPSAGAGAPPTEQKWRTYGPSTAISTALVTIDGKPTRATSVWVKQDSAWKVASVQLTTVAAK